MIACALISLYIGDMRKEPVSRVEPPSVASVIDSQPVPTSKDLEKMKRQSAIDSGYTQPSYEPRTYNQPIHNYPQNSHTSLKPGSTVSE